MVNNSINNTQTCPTCNSAQDKNNWHRVLPSGTKVSLKLTGEKLLIFEDVPHDVEDPRKEKVGIKYLTRTVDHKKKVVFACEIVPIMDNQKSPA